MNSTTAPHTDPRIPGDFPSPGRLETALRSAAQQLAARSTAPFERLFGPQVDGAFGILMYHRTSHHYLGAPAPTWNVTPERFRRQMLGLLRRGFEPWPLRDILDHHQRRHPIPPRAFVVTFDDGHASNFHHAWPILRELNIPATIFLATAYLDSDAPFPFDDWAAVGSGRVERESWLPLTTRQCVEMHDGGLIELGAHTHTHADFRDRPDALRSDLATCLSELQTRFGYGDATSAFPYGTKRMGFSGPVPAAAAKRAGMLCSLTTESERVSPSTDPFDWGRFTAHGYDTAATLAVKLSGWYERLRNTWRRIRRLDTRHAT
ncbi:MAG: polysaccharide deacetylase family protein [Planctomycetaceae bacterium]